MTLRYSLFYRLVALLLVSAPAYAQIGIGTTTPNSKAVLELSATDKGLLLPRLTAAQRRAIAAPPLGLTVFQTGTDSVGYWYYSGVRWTWLSAQQADNLGNHTATRNLNLGTNQLVGNGGTTGLSIASNGYVGLGTTTPVSRISFGASVGNDPGSRIANYEATNGRYFYGTGLVEGSAGFGLGLWGGTGTNVPWNGSTGIMPHIFMLGGGGVGIGTLTPHTSALLDLSSTSKGMLFPRMTPTQRDAIVNPSPGLMVFNSYSQRASIYTGAAWADLLIATEAAERSARFNYTGGPQQWIVPAGVTSVQVVAAGARGGTSSSFAPSPGGWGGMVSATLPVTPGEALTIQVGGAGEMGAYFLVTTAAYNGGGRGYFLGGGGGGGTDIRRGSTLADRIIVAGGGGGATNGEPGGCGGGLVACGGVKAGTQSSGGVGSCGSSTNGDFGIGGDFSSGYNMPGGGGGYYGGAAGCQRSAGGGSSYTLPAATNVVHTQGANFGDGYVIISYMLSLPLAAPTLSGVNFQNVPASSLTGTVATANLPALTATPFGTQVTLSLGTGNSATFSVADNDNSATNELQTITKTGNTVSLSNGGGSFSDTDTDNQSLSLSGAALGISGGTGITLPDASATNEVQTLSKTGTQITLSTAGGTGGGTVTDADNQSLTLSGATLGISGGTGITLPDASSTNELQTLSISGSTISLSNGGAVTVPSSADNLGNHFASQNLALNSHWLSNGNSDNGLRIDAAGNVGVGTATPVSRLSLGDAGESNMASTRIANFEDSAGRYFYGTGLVFNTAHYGLGIWGGSGAALPYDGVVNGQSANPHLFVEDRGYVGVGTVFPDTRLDVFDKNLDSYQVARFTSLNDIGTGISLRSMAGNGRTYTLLTTSLAGGGGAGGFGLYDEGSSSVIAGYRWYVKTNGFMGIGTTTPAKRLDVAGDAVIRGTLEVTGNVSFCGGGYTCSDRRYKKDITPLQSALAHVLKLNGYTYFWRLHEFKDKGFTADRQLGFIAQEIETLYPEMVLTDPQTGYKSVDYAKLTPVLVEAIKELKGQLDQQAQQAARASDRAQRAEAAVQSFESRLRALETGGAAAQK